MRGLCHREHRGGKLSKARFLRLIEIAVAASHCPKIFSHAMRKVGWAEDDDGKLVYNPLATCDKSALTAYRSAASAAAGAASAAVGVPPRRSGTYDSTDAFMGRGGPVAELAQSTLRELLCSAVDDTDDEDDYGEPKRRCAPGQVTTNETWRASKRAKAAAKEAKAEKMRVNVFNEYDRVRSVLATEKELPVIANANDLSKLTMPKLMVYIEVRTCKKLATNKPKAFYLTQANEVIGNPIRLAAGSVPEGYPEWLAAQTPLA